MRTVILFLFVTILAGCKGSNVITSTGKHLDELYRAAMADACYPEQSEISYNLLSLTDSNADLIRKTIKGEEYVLMVSLKANASYYKNDQYTGFYNTSDYPIWVTVAPQLLRRLNPGDFVDMNLRLKQLLGLPPDKTVYGYIVEFWVRPQDLFRPCPDKEIDDTQCDLCFPANTDSAHIQWINKSRIDRYYKCGLFNQYPWTQLGYTYDWHPGNPTHVGLSEFVIGKDKNVVVHKIYSTEEYFIQRDE
ncbi:hypothetical protein DMA11_08470 [Marinilabiliaceae bacterium JC017]|nr:hypothetical protein DMA11_08470 [Marinilabiliaceae bacterium JC017]